MGYFHILGNVSTNLGRLQLQPNKGTRYRLSVDGT